MDQQGQRQVDLLEQTMATTIASSPLLTLDYVAICDPANFTRLDPLPTLTPAPDPQGLLLAISARAGAVRLTDNIQFSSNGYWLM